jgi:hypothetical protein
MQPTRCRGPLPLSRREVLQVGAAGLLGLSLPGLLRAEQHRRAAASADACIILFLNGGPSHLDMWDMKPAAPAEIRGEFRPVGTSLPGVQFSEHLPRLARHMHRATLVRSMHHTVNNAHAAAVYVGLTGEDRGEANVTATGPTNYPSVGSVVGMARTPETTVVPYVAMPYITQEGRGGPPQQGFQGGFLGRALDPFWVLRDPNSPGFGMDELALAADISRQRLADRQRLSGGLDGHRLLDRRLQDADSYRVRAFELLTSPATRRAFQIEREPDSLRDAYGRNIYGQSTLLARRLIEAGTRVATISWAPDANATWDTHGANFTKLRTELLPQLDMAVSSLLEDLHVRGMLDRTLVAVMGEFGRSPRVNGAAGRDHWNFCYGLMLAGGGIRKGSVYGASDRIGAYPSRNPLRPADILATMYHCLGLSPDFELRDRQQRPYALVPWGSVINDLLE